MLQNNSDNLLTFVSNLSGISYKRVEEDLGQGYVRLDIAEAERRQAKHDIRMVEDVVAELLRNSREAGAKNIFIAFYKKNKNKRHITVIDDGCGIPQAMHQKIFESRVTSKLDSVVFDEFGIHGRGMALYSIKSVVDNAEIVYSKPEAGTTLQIIADTSKLPERKDQSSFPSIKIKKGVPVISKGTHNVPRLLLEFSIRYPKIRLYFGSPSQILAVLYAMANTKIGNKPEITSGAFAKGEDRKIIEPISSVKDAKKLSLSAGMYFGLEVSERNAWRILGGKLKPMQSIENYFINQQEEKISEEDIYNKDMNVTKYIPKEELEDLSKEIGKTFRKIEQKYFIKIQGEPKVTKQKNQINITIKFNRDDYCNN